MKIEDLISNTEKEVLVQQALLKAMSYETYRALVDKHTATGTSTGPNQTESLSNYTMLNQRRLKRPSSQQPNLLHQYNLSCH